MTVEAKNPPAKGRLPAPAMRELEKRLGRRFRRAERLREALTHPSVFHEARQSGDDNQRLEYLGDAVLQLLCTEYLFKQYPRAREGDLTQQRARLVNRQAMCDLARQLDIGSHLIMSRSEEANDGRRRQSNLADAIEAVIGAIHIDGGWKAAQKFGVRVLEPFWAARGSDIIADNPKGALQELLQAIAPETPVYSVLKEEGPDHARQFLVAVEWQGKRLGSGSGPSKKEAEASAAAAALRDRSWTEPSRESPPGAPS